MKTKLNYETMITQILESYPPARENDKILYGICCKQLGFDVTIPLREYLLRTDFPSYDSISRCRRKVQSVRVDLVDAQTQAKRKENEELYHSYYSHN